ANRGQFAGEAGPRDLHPDLAGAAAWDERACAPLLLGGARVAAVHRRLLDRAQTQGWALGEDAAPRLTVDGREMVGDAQGRVALPAAAREVRLVSRSFVPAWLGLGPDARRLGVPVTLLRLDGRRLPRAAFRRGWYAAEGALRWTDGDALLTLPQRDRPMLLRIGIGAAGAVYWQAADDAALRRAAAV
ncbi:MAG: hypothetical protein M0Z28_00055, partial [Rhodospirillales bacterium]|nr:hypothetical protein [Rhodospirillales bacterium]